jgi:hypothetical protein
MNAYKYIYRAGNKDGSSEVTDIEKALWYFKFVNNRLYSSVGGNKTIKLYNDIKHFLQKRDLI